MGNAEYHGDSSSKQLEEAPSKAIIFQTFHLNNLSTRYFKMKIFFALALVVFGFTWSVVLGVNTVEENASGVGGWGGTCQCPDGTTYEVGDNKDGCETLACVNGEKLDCNERDGDWSNRKVTCSDPWILEETGKYCPDAISFPNWGSNAFSLGECKTHCEADGAETLTFYPDNTNCRCCTASSELLESSSSDSQIYTAIQYKLESYEDCTDDSECASNYCYSFTGRCTNRGDIGDSCFWKGDCASGNCKNNRCADNSGIGKCTCF